MLKSLNEEQRKAVLHKNGPMLVTAGPGSGKTHVITARLLYMIHVHQIPPEKIAVITFTKEAAKSMGVTRFVEFGPGKVLSGLIKKIDPQLETFNVGDVASLEATAAAF